MSHYVYQVDKTHYFDSLISAFIVIVQSSTTTSQIFQSMLTTFFINTFPQNVHNAYSQMISSKGVVEIAIIFVIIHGGKLLQQNRGKRCGLSFRERCRQHVSVHRGVVNTPLGDK